MTAKERPSSSPGFRLRATTAVTVEMPKMAPACRNIPRSPETAATSSGASASVALFAAGLQIPMPTPVTPP